MASKKSQKALLKKLEEYGDSFLEQREGKQLKKQKKTKTSKTQEQNEETESVKKKKKNKMKKMKNKLIKNSQNGDIVKSDRKMESRKMKWLREALGNDGAAGVMRPAEEKESAKTQSRKKQPEVIVFEDPAKRKRKVEETDENTMSKTNEFDMRSARFEVRKLGISGFDREKKSDARVSLLISLGAKPPRKKSYVNYKEFQQQRKSEIDAERQRRTEEQVPGEKLPKKRPKKGSRPKGELSGIDGQIGHYKQGVQFIGKGMVKKMTTS